MKGLKNYYNSISGQFVLGLILALFFSLSAYSQDVEKGKKLFNTDCAACHKLEQRLIGPPLKGVAAIKTKKWLHDWVRNSTALIKSGDADAIAIFKEYNEIPMTSFANLTDQDIENIFAYVDAKPEVKKAKATLEKNVVIKKDYYVEMLILTLAIIIILTVVLYKLKYMLLLLDGGKKTSSYLKEVTAYVSYVIKHNKLKLGIIGFIGTIYIIWILGIGIGVDKGYQPIQPIAFSHKVHAGDQEIDCQYCHSSARTSKTSGIPSANVCMNCHKFIQEGTNTGKKEIAKIYDAIGFDPKTNTYIKDYKQKPIKWIRIHNLPDFVYYNHSQHVTVGKLECQTCHGPVEKMEEVYQYSPLTMTWCLECHKTEEIKMKGNGYYEKIHKQLAEKFGKEKLTVSMMGGLECGKCHY